MWEADININEIKELRLKTNVFFGVGAISKIDYILKDLKKKGISKVIVVTGKEDYKICGAWEHVEKAFKNNHMDFINYEGVKPNPTTAQVDESTNIAIEFGAQAVIAIGGGSAIDTGKSTAILMEYKDKTAKELYELKFVPTKAAPIVAINMTHGTGTEVNRFAVATETEKDYKPAIAYDCIYPTWSIDDPAVMLTLPAEQSVYVSIDAVNHVIEAATTKSASVLSISLAKETIRLVAKYLPEVIKSPKSLEARYFLTYAALLAGVSFDNSLLHYTHALEHPLSALKPDLSHGLGLAILLPAVIKNIYPYKSKTLADILEPIVPELKGTSEEAQFCAAEVEKWLNSVGITSKLKDKGFTKDDIQKLVALTFETPSLELLLSMAPSKSSKETVEKIFLDSLESTNK